MEQLSEIFNLLGGAVTSVVLPLLGVLYICIQGTITGYPNDLKDLAILVQKVEEEPEL